MEPCGRRSLLLVYRRLLHGTRLILPWPATGQVPSLNELRVVNHPETAEVVLVADKALVQGEVGADGVLVRKQRDRD